jgi:hypothetical protein
VSFVQTLNRYLDMFTILKVEITNFLKMCVNTLFMEVPCLSEKVKTQLRLCKI